MALKILKIAAAFDRSGDSRSGGYAKVAEGTFVPQVARGVRGAGFPEHEVDALVAARMAGAVEVELKLLVKALVAERSALAGATDREIQDLVKSLVAKYVQKIEAVS